MQIYRWYKIMSPGIDIDIHSISKLSIPSHLTNATLTRLPYIAFDEKNNLLYVTMTQDFRIWIIPGHRATVKLTSLLKLVKQYATPEPPPQRRDDRESHRPRRISLPPQSPSERHVQFTRLPPSPLSRETTSILTTTASSEDTVIHEPEANADPWLNYAAGRTTSSSTEGGDLPSPRRTERQRATSYTSALSTTQERTRDESRELYYIASQDDLYQTSEFVKFVLPFGIGTAVVLVWHVFATVFSVLGVLVWWPVVMLEERGLVGWVPGNINQEAVESGKRVEDVCGGPGRMRDGGVGKKIG